MIERDFDKALKLRENRNVVRQFAIRQAMDILRAAGVVDPALEAEVQPSTHKVAKPEAAPKIDLRQQTYEHLYLVREPSEQEKEALERRGIVFIPLETKSYAQVVAEDPDYFLQDELKYANARPQLKDYVLPVAVSVGLKPTELALPGSFSKSRDVQLQMIDAYSRQLQTEFPDARAIMLPSTGYAQADRAYKLQTGEVLFKNYFARALDDLSGVSAACAGRYDPAGRFGVDVWDARGGDVGVGGVPAVVFVGNK